MRHISKHKRQDCSINNIEWVDAEEVFELRGGRVYFEVDQLLYFWEVPTSGQFFAAIKNGEIYVSNIEWLGENETQLHDLIKNGVSPYEALAFMEL